MIYVVLITWFRPPSAGPSQDEQNAWVSPVPPFRGTAELRSSRLLQTTLSKHLSKLFLSAHIDRLRDQLSVAVIHEAFGNTLDAK